jgi:hypothetical protein
MSHSEQGRIEQDQSVQDQFRQFLRAAVLPMPDHPEPARDLWPKIVHQFDLDPQLVTQPVAQAVTWFDWVLAGALGLFVVAFPAAIPMLLYYL